MTVRTEEIETSVRNTIVAILERNERNVPDFAMHDELMATGLGSLDLAAVIAQLEQQWGVDPFLEHTPITEVRTVGELSKAYEDCLAGREVGPAEDLAETIARARRRK